MEAALGHYRPFLSEFHQKSLTGPLSSISLRTICSLDSISPSSPQSRLNIRAAPLSLSSVLSAYPLTPSDTVDGTFPSTPVSPLRADLTAGSEFKTNLDSCSQSDLNLPVPIIPSRNIPLITLDPKIAVPKALSYLNPLSYLGY